jgi:hypothetical protein
VERVISGNLHGHILFSNLIRSGGNLGSGFVVSFIDLSKAEKRNICPDPVCNHKYGSCKYTGFQNIRSYGDEEIYYDTAEIYNENSFYSALYEIIPSEDTVKEIFRTKMPPAQEGGGRLGINSIIDRFIFLDEYRYYKKINEHNEEYREYEIKYYGYIRSTGEVEHLYDISGVENDEETPPQTDGTVEVELSHLIFTDDKVYFCGYSEYLKIVNYRSVDIPDGYKVMGSDCIYRDIPTGDIWLGFRMKNEEDVENFKGYICRFKENGELEKISMPADNIYDFTLTDKYIYYTVFDPVIYGYAREGVVCANQTKSRIWRVSRETLENPELIFDGKCEFLFNNPTTGWIVYGDCIYSDYYSLEGLDSGKIFHRMGSVVAINFVENTIKWFNLD